MQMLTRMAPTRAAYAAYLGVKESRRAGERVKARWDGEWLFEYGNGVVPARLFRTPTQMESETKQWFCWGYTPGRGDVVVDVGAGVGTEALPFSRMVGDTGRVFCLEAHPASHATLLKVVELNGLRNVEVIQVAISDTEGTVAMRTAQNVDSHALAVDGDVEVSAMTLDAFVAEHGVYRIDLLKMNIEGAERQAFRAADAAMKVTSHVAVSCHDFLADAGRAGEEVRTRAEVHAYLIDQGFTITTNEDGRPITRDYLYAAK